MTAPHDPPQADTPGTPGTTWWEDEGQRIAGQLREISSALVVAANSEDAGRVALGIARAESKRRHVALGDLTGDAAPLYAVAGGEDAFGLSDCLRQGLPLNDIARRAPDRESLFILPAGSPPVACEEILAHERWPRLVNGFAKEGALLLLVVPLDAPGMQTLLAATSGSVLVDVDASRAAALRAITTVSTPRRTENLMRARASRGRRLAALGILVAVVAAGAAVWFAREPILAAYHAVAAKRNAARVVPIATASVPTAPAAPTAAMPPADTVRLTDPVNPADTSGTVPFAVEVMAANTLAGANSFLADNAKQTSRNGATVSPVTVGASTSVWYKVVVGASHARAGADSLLAAMRRGKLLRSGEGLVVKVPYALVLADNLEQSTAQDLHDSWQKRGFNTYLLVQSDGSVRLFAGAFETPAQAAPLASALRAAGTAPVLAFRTGRTY